MGIAFTGMSSGLDTDSMIEAMLYTQQSKIDKKYQEKMTITYKQDVWDEVNDKLEDFYSKYVTELVYQSTFSKYTATSSNSAVSVSATSSAASGTHVFSVHQLAEGAQASTNSITGKKVTNNTTLSELGVLGNTALSITTTAADGTENVESIAVRADYTLYELKYLLAEKGIDLDVDEDTSELTLSQNSSSTASNIEVQGGLLKKLGMSSSDVNLNATSTDGNGSAIGTISTDTTLAQLGLTDAGEITLNGTTLTINTSDSIGTVVSKLKSADSNLNVSFDETSKSFLISTKETGESSVISIGGDSEVLSKLGLNSGTTLGKNAVYTYNGNELEAESNTVTINGVTATFNSVTDANGDHVVDDSEKVNVQVKQDTDALVDFITGFVEDYNALIEDLNSKYNAKACEYDPFTEAQEEEATDEQKEKREEVIKESVLRRDDTLYDILSSMRSSLYASVADNKYGSLAGIGITTGDYTENGKLYVDEDKLREALNEDPEEVMKLFTNREGTNSNGKSTTGIGQLLYKKFQNMRTSIDGVKSYGKYYSDKSMKDELDEVKDRIKVLKERYESQKKMYQDKFSAMETALASLNSQQSTLSSYFS